MQWLLAGRLVDGTLNPPRQRVAIGLDGERIRAITPLAEWQPPPREAATIIDHLDASVVPGLIDSHVHLVFDHAPDSAAIRHRVQFADSVELGLLAASNAARCLSAGVTTVRDCGGRDLITLHVRDAIQQGLVAGPRILAAGPPIMQRGGHLSWCGVEANTADELRRRIQDLCDSGVDVIKLVASGGNMTPGSEPFTATYSEAELRAAVDQAHLSERRVAVHALNAESIRRAIAADVDSIEHCLWNGPDGQYAFDATAAREMVRRGSIFVGANMAGIDRILLPADAPRKQLRERWAGTREMLALGARVMLSSDAGTRGTRFDEFGLSLVCGVEALDVSPLEAIHRATLVPAEALGVDTDLGTIEIGKRADLVVVDGDPARTISDIRRVREVWQDGHIVARPDSSNG
jgi:imidazolonepropionase-like amidohydrolase